MSSRPRPSCNEKIKVYVRLKPIDTNLVPNLKLIKATPTSIIIRHDQHSEDIKNCYTFSKVFSESTTQKQLFEGIMLPQISQMIELKKEFLTFSYGITNMGKTFSIIGRKGQPGLLVQAVSLLLEIKSLFGKSNKTLSFHFFNI